MIAEETVAILRRGGYAAANGAWVDLSGAMAAAMASVRCFVADGPLVAGAEDAGAASPMIEVTDQTTLAAAKELLDNGAPDVCCLNFASARRAGGGYLSGGEAQEESLARASGLAPPLETATAFHQAHRDAGSALYADAIAFVDSVPVFREDQGALLAEPWSCAILSAAAPNLRALREEGSALVS